MKLLTKLRDLGTNANQQENTYNPLSPGSAAPDFTLTTHQGQQIQLGDFRGKPVILAFYPADHSPVCSNQLALYNEALPIFAEYDAQLLGISVDNPATHRAFAAGLRLKFPLLADHTPKGNVSHTYGVYDAANEQSQRALFVIDTKGIVQWSQVVPKQVNPGAHGILHALKTITA